MQYLSFPVTIKTAEVYNIIKINKLENNYIGDKSNLCMF